MHTQRTAMLDEEEGTHLIINGINSSTPDFLFNYFDDPNPNNHGNSMRLFYELKPFSGELKVFSRSNMLTSTIKIGWESLPIVYPEPSDIKQNYANSVETCGRKRQARNPFRSPQWNTRKTR